MTAKTFNFGGLTVPVENVPAPSGRIEHTAHSIDGDVKFTMDELRAGVGTDWSDTQLIPVTSHGFNDHMGNINPFTGEFTLIPAED